LWSVRSNFHFNQLVWFILSSTNFNLKILFAIDDRRTKKITWNFVNTTLVKLEFISLNWFKTCMNLHVLMQINWSMFGIPVIWKPLDNHIEFEWKFKFLMKYYESACWHGGNSSYLVATRPISIFAPCWIWCQIHFLLENLWSYMKNWLKYVLFSGHQMGFVPQPIKFGVKFRFLLKFYVITWKNGWNTSYLVATR
jgi:hypothetical protein